MADEANFIIRLRDKLSGPARKMRAGLAGLRSGLQSMGEKAQRMTFGERMKSQAMKFTKWAGIVAVAAAGMFVKSTIQTGAGFGEAISAVGAVGLQTRDQIAALEEKAKDLGATTKFTATEAANAMEIMARAGFKNQQILAGVGGVLDAAAASGLGIAEVADHVSNVLKGMGLAASDATRVADVLAVASSKTNSTIGSLGESMRNVAATARELNIPLEDTVAAVALLQDVGLDASVAGSSLNTMLTRMAKPSKTIAKQMDQWGISFKDASGNMLPFEKVLEQVSMASERAGGNFDKVAFLADLVGLRGQKAASNLAYLFESGRVGDLTEQLKDANGGAKKMAELRMDNLIGDWTLLESAIDGVKTELFETQDSALRGMVQGFKDWITETQKTGGFVAFLESAKTGLAIVWQWVSALAEGFMSVLGAIFGFDSATGGLESFGNLISTISDYLVVYRNEIATVFKWVGKLAAAALIVVAAFKTWGAVVAVFAGLKVVIGIIAAVVAAVGFIPLALAAAAIAIWYYWDEIKSAFTTAWTAITGTLAAMWQSMKEWGPMIGAALMDGLLMMLNPARIVTKVMSLGSSVISAAKKAFGIASPSKEFEWIGEMNMQGMERGFTANDNALNSAVGRVAGSKMAVASNADTPPVSGGASGGNTINLHVEQHFHGAGPEQQKQAAQSTIEMLTQALEDVA